MQRHKPESAETYHYPKYTTEEQYRTTFRREVGNSSCYVFANQQTVHAFYLSSYLSFYIFFGVFLRAIVMETVQKKALAHHFWFPSWFPFRLFCWRSGISAQSSAILWVLREESCVGQPEEPERNGLSPSPRGSSFREEACSLSRLFQAGAAIRRKA